MTRYFVRFRDAVDRVDSMTMLVADEEQYKPAFPSVGDDADRLIIADLSKEEAEMAIRNGAELFEDIQFQPTPNVLKVLPDELEYWKTDNVINVASLPWMSLDVSDVMEHNGAATAWNTATGKNVTIGIIDTGIAGSMPEFPPARQSPMSKSFAHRSTWSDPKGHGSMCACAAGASTKSRGRYNGVAPDSLLMSLKTTFFACDVYMLYDYVISQKICGNFPGPVVLNNSYARAVCSSPGMPANHPLLNIIRLAVDHGIPVIFGAGNNHVEICAGDPEECSPNTIWGPNSLDEVLSVGTVNWAERMDGGAHADSSRGPGEFASAHPKPDCVAPTYGKIVRGCGYQTLQWWGTSGASAQVAGLAALLLEKNPSLAPGDVYDAIRGSCRCLGLHQNCQGAGIIDCAAALASV